MTLDLNYSVWWLLPIAALAGLAAWWLYQKSSDVLPTWAKWTLTAFRFLLLFIIGILLLEPLLNSIQKKTTPPVVAIIQDDSESISIQRDSLFVKNEYPKLLAQFRDEFGEDVEVEMFSFSDQVNPLNDPDSLSFLQTGTNISKALEKVNKLYTNHNLGAIVLVSDGISTSGINPKYLLDDINVPIFTALLGDTTEQMDLRIGEVLYNEIAYLETEMPVRAKINAVGISPQTVKVTLTQGNKTLASKDLVIDPNRPSQEVDFAVKPEVVGLQAYGLHVTHLNGELTYKNNHKSIFVNVLETRMKIAIFGGSPHPDIAALHKAFERDDRYEVNDFIHKNNTEFFDDPIQYNLKDFDLIILHNFPYNANDKAVIEKIAEVHQRNKTPLMVFAGIYTDLATLSILKEHLAITPSVQSAGYEEVQLNFKSEYAEHSTFTFEKEWLQIFNNSPPIKRNRSEWKAKGAAKVFSTTKIKGIQLDYPIFALWHHLSRKNMVFVGEGFWRMRSHAYVETGSFDHFDTWIANNIQWLVVQEDKRRFKVTPSKPIFSGNELIIFKGQAYDESYNPIKGAEIKLKIKNSQGTENVYYLSRSGDANYFLELSNLEEGTYSYEAEGKKGEVNLGKDRGQFSIGRSNIEHFNLKADKGLLRQLSLRTEAQHVNAKDLLSLVDPIKNYPTVKPKVENRKNRTGFNELWWIFFLLLTLVTVEWVTRKIYSLI